VKNFLDLKGLQVQETPGRVVRAFRRNFELTLGEMERLTGIPESNLSAIENDKLDMGIRRATRIAAVFGINPSLILFPKGHERKEEKELRKIRKDAAALIEKKRAAAG
jgi:transcriptional regulator with XRE-family HTH domain